MSASATTGVIASAIAPAGGGGFALDAYEADLTAAYSVGRRLLTSWENALIRVRRSSDNAEQDIGYDGSGELDASALATFVGANDALIVTLYDQTGGGNHYVQATSTEQPKVVNGGTLYTLNGHAVAQFDGSNDHLDAPADLIDFSGTTTYIALKSDTTSGNHYGIGRGSTYKWYFPLQLGASWRYDAAATTISSAGTVDTNAHVHAMWKSATQAAAYLDGSQRGTTVSETNTAGDAGGIESIGSFQGVASSPWNGCIGEYVVFGVAHNSGSDLSDISTEMGAYWVP